MKKRRSLVFISLLMMAYIVGCANPNVGVGIPDAPSNVTPPPADVTPPAKVTGLTAVEKNTAILLEWTNPADSDFDGVEITFTPSATEITQPITLGKTLTSHNVMELTNDTVYTFTVKTIDTSGNKSAGVTVQGMPSDDAPPPDVIPPGNVAELAAVVGDAAITLNWTNPADADFNGVEITFTPSATGITQPIALGKTLTSRTVTGLTNNTAYTFTVKTIDTSSNMSGGVTVQGTPADVTPPANVTGLTAVAGDGSVALNWTNPTDSDFDGVEITFTPSATGITQPITLGKTVTSRTVTGLTNKTAYTFTVKAIDTSSNKSDGVTVQKTPADVTPPGNVTGLVASVGNAAITLNWTNPTDSDFDGVVITFTPLATGITQPITLGKTVTSRTVTGLTNDTTYTFTVKAIDTSENKSSGVAVQRTCGDSKTFNAQTATDNSWYTVTAANLAESSHAIVYAEGGHNISAAAAQAIVNEYETNIYGKITSAFGTIEDVDGNGKVIFLLLDIVDGFTGAEGEGYVAGYFQPYHMYAKSLATYSNEADMLFLDVYPAQLGSSGFYSTIAHELQHLINFSNTVLNGGTEQDLWINEGLSSGAEYIYCGHQNDRINYFNADTKRTIRYGNNFFVWNGYWEQVKGDVLADYATAYLFFQYLRIHASNGVGIYKDIINSSYRDYRAVTGAAGTRIDPSLSNWETLLGNWMLANAQRASTGLLGYKGEITLTLNYFTSTGGATWSFSPGEGIFTDLSTSSNGFIPSVPGTHIRYVGLAANGSLDKIAPYTGKYLLTFNADTNNKNGDETGYLANTVATGTPSLNILRNGASVPASALPQIYPIDIHFSPDGSLSPDSHQVQSKGNNFQGQAKAQAQ